MRPTRFRAVVAALVVVVGACGSSTGADVASPADSAGQEDTVPLPSTDAIAATSEASKTSVAPTSTAASPTTSGATPSTVAPTTTTASPADLVTLVGGGQLDLNSVEGTDTVLWFWAPW